MAKPSRGQLWEQVMSGEASAVGQIRRGNVKRILDMAEREFAVNGFNGATTTSIAKRAGLSKANLHYYFGTKLDLYTAVIGRILDKWLACFDDISENDDPREALAKFIHAKVMYSKSHPLASRIFASEVIRGAPALKEYLEQELREWVETKAAVLEAWMDQGRMDRVDSVHLIFMIWAVSQHYADFGSQVRAVMGREELTDADYEAVATTVTQIILKGVGIEID